MKHCKENQQLVIENDILKQAVLIMNICDSNAHKYSVSVMYEFLQISRSAHYYEVEQHNKQEE